MIAGLPSAMPVDALKDPQRQRASVSKTSSRYSHDLSHYLCPWAEHLFFACQATANHPDPPKSGRLGRFFGGPPRGGKQRPLVDTSHFELYPNTYSWPSALATLRWRFSGALMEFYIEEFDFSGAWPMSWLFDLRLKCVVIYSICNATVCSGQKTLSGHTPCDKQISQTTFSKSFLSWAQRLCGGWENSLSIQSKCSLKSTWIIRLRRRMKPSDGMQKQQNVANGFKETNDCPMRNFFRLRDIGCKPSV